VSHKLQAQAQGCQVTTVAGGCLVFKAPPGMHPLCPLYDNCLPAALGGLKAKMVGCYSVSCGSTYKC
jgi:hypothetical protein